MAEWYITFFACFKSKLCMDLSDDAEWIIWGLEISGNTAITSFVWIEIYYNNYLAALDQTLT